MRISEKDDHKILIIAYHFPPDAAVGALRPQKFAKYLPEFGWKPYVLTIKEKDIEESDAGRLNDVKNVPLFRTHFIPNPIKFCLQMRDRIFRKSGIRNHKCNTATPENIYKLTLIQKIRKGFIDLCYMPDIYLFWAITAVAKGVSIVKGHNIRYIYATSPPHSVDIIGYLISRMTGARLIIDHRDPWALCNDRSEVEYAVRMHHCLERIVFDHASCIVTTSDKYTQMLKELSPANKHKIHSIYNGYDGDDFKAEDTELSHDTFVLTHLGSLYIDRSPVTFIRVVGQLTKEHNDIARSLRINFFGSGSNPGGISPEQIVAEEGLEDSVRFYDQVPYQDAIEYMRTSHVLLLFAPNQYYQIPAKTFDYMASHRPVLAFTEDDGSTADLIRAFKAGVVVPQDDAEKIREGLIELYRNRLNRDAYYRNVDISVLERKRQTQRFAAILDSIQC